MTKAIRKTLNRTGDVLKVYIREPLVAMDLRVKGAIESMPVALRNQIELIIHPT